MLVVVIPTKNRLDLLKRAIKSVLDQDFREYRVIVINDGSSDGTGEYLSGLNDPKIEVITHEESRGVNASRNDAFKKLKPGEWAIPLDDDDLFLTGAFEVIHNALIDIPDNIQVAQFSTAIQAKDREYFGGRDFLPGENYYDPNYKELITDVGHRMLGEPRSVFKWTLFPKYLFNEDINGFEGEWWLKVSKDNVGIRIFNTKPIIHIDWVHPQEHLSDTAAQRDPGSFARAHKRIFDEHSEFIDAHSEVALHRSKQAFKVALKAYDLSLALRFAVLYLKAIVKRIFP